MIAVVAVFGGLVAIALIALVVVLIRRRFKRQKRTYLTTNGKHVITTPPMLLPPNQRRVSIDTALKPRDEGKYNIQLCESPSKFHGYAGTTWGDLPYDTIKQFQAAAAADKAEPVQSATSITSPSKPAQTKSAWVRPAYEMTIPMATSPPSNPSSPSVLVPQQGGHTYETVN